MKTEENPEAGFYYVFVLLEYYVIMSIASVS